MATISQTSTFEVPKFFSFRGVLPVAWPRAAASRGNTPLHLAVFNGRDSVVQRLLEAKAAVDAKDVDSRGLRGGYWCGNLMKPWDSVVRK